MQRILLYGLLICVSGCGGTATGPAAAKKAPKSRATVTRTAAAAPIKKKPVAKRAVTPRPRKPKRAPAKRPVPVRGNGAQSTPVAGRPVAHEPPPPSHDITVIRGPEAPASGQAEVLKVGAQGDLALRQGFAQLRSHNKTSAAPKFKAALRHYAAASAEARKRSLKGLIIKFRHKADEAAAGLYRCLPDK